MSHLPMSSQTRSLSVPDGDSLYLMMIISNVVFPFLELKIENANVIPYLNILRSTVRRF